MDRLASFGGRSIRRLRLGIILLLLPSIFVFDTITNYEIAAAVFYIVVILLSVGLLPTRGVVALAVLCVVLTLVSFVMTPGGNRGAGMVNVAISISAIAITAFLAIRMVAAEVAAHDARAQLTRLARVTSLGALTTSIAHEVNQPLTAIVMSGHAGLRWLDQAPAHPENVRRNLERIVADAKRASDIIARVRSLSRGDAPKKARVNLHDLVADMLSLARADINHNGISIETEIEDGLPDIMADPVQLQQVLCNLILNAIEALKETPESARHLEIHARADRHDDVVISVKDNGSGVRPDMLDHMFDAFFTTKSGGIGMGLTITRAIVEAHGGQIWVHPNTPRGASFYFSLPVKDGASL